MERMVKKGRCVFISLDVIFLSGDTPRQRQSLRCGFTGTCEDRPRFIPHPPLRPSTAAAHHHILKTLVHDPHLVPGVGLVSIGLAVLARFFGDIRGFRVSLNHGPSVHLDLLSEGLVLADRYDIETVRLRLRPSLVEFAETGSPRAYAIACRPGFEDEVKVPSSHTAPIDILGLAKLLDEPKFIPVIEYHRLILLHS